MSPIDQAVVVFNWITAESFLKKCRPMGSEVFFTDSPHAYERLAGHGLPVQGISNLMGVTDSFRIFARANSLALKTKEMFSQWSASHDLPDLGLSLSYFLPRAFCGVIYQAAFLEYLFRLDHRVVIPYLPEEDSANPSWTHHQELLFTNGFARLTTHDPTLAARVDLVALEAAVGLRETEHKGASPRRQKELVGLLALLNRPSQFLQRFIVWLLENRADGLRLWLRPRRGTVEVVDVHNLLIRDLLPWLLWKGHRVRRLARPQDPETFRRQDLTRFEAELQDRFRRLFHAEDLAFLGRVAPAAQNMLTSLFSRHVAYRIAPLMRNAQDFCRRRYDGGRTGLVLTSHSYDPTTMAIILTLSENGSSLICFTHGEGKGYSIICDQVERPFDNWPAYDAYVAAHRKEKEFYAGIDGSKPIFEMGAARGKVVRAGRLSRRLVRWHQGLKTDRPILFYVPTTFHSPLYFGPGDVLDIPYWLMMKRLVFEVLPQTPYWCYVKMYPKAETREPHPLTEMTLPDNVFLIENIDYRFVRSGPDVTILDKSSGSTHGWAAGTGNPLIIWETGFSFLDEYRPAFEEALFFVDGRQEDWSERMIELLQMSLDQLRAGWERKAAARRKFYEEFYLGRRESSRRLYDWMMKTAQDKPRRVGPAESVIPADRQG